MMRKRFVVFLSTLLIIGFTAFQIPQKMITGIRYTHNLDIINEQTGEKYTVNNFVNLFHYEDLILYQIPIKWMNTDLTGDTIKTELTDSVSGFQYFIYNKFNNWGFFYPNDKEVKGHKLATDSVIEKILGFRDPNFFCTSNDILVKTYKNAACDSILEKYIPRIKYDDSYPDSTYLYFSKSDLPINFSLSEKLEIEKKMKLTKAIMIYNPIYKDRNQYNFDIPRRELFFEINRIPVFDSEYIIGLFNRLYKL